MTANKALIAAVSDDTKASLSSMVLEAGLTDVSVTNGKNLRDLCAEHDYDVVISVFPFEGEFGAETAAYISKTFDVCQVIFVPSKVYDSDTSKVISKGAGCELHTLRRSYEEQNGRPAFGKQNAP